MAAICRCCASFLGLVLPVDDGEERGVGADADPKCFASRAFAAAFFSGTGAAEVLGVQECALGSLCLRRGELNVRVDGGVGGVLRAEGLGAS